MATFIDCGHGDWGWMAFEEDARVLINPTFTAKTLKELADNNDLKGLVITSGCLTCASPPKRI